MALKDFISDGCSGVPDFDIRHCCEHHDYNYSEHSNMSRDNADLLFFQCIVSKGKNKNFLTHLRYNWLGLYYWFGVRVFGKKYYKGKG